MKIKDMNIIMPPEKTMKMKIDKLMAGKDLDDSNLNRIMKYLGFDNEEAICVLMRCYECPYYTEETGVLCATRFNEYVRHLIAVKNRCDLEDML